MIISLLFEFYVWLFPPPSLAVRHGRCARLVLQVVHISTILFASSVFTPLYFLSSPFPTSSVSSSRTQNTLLVNYSKSQHNKETQKKNQSQPPSTSSPTLLQPARRRVRPNKPAAAPTPSPSPIVGTLTMEDMALMPRLLEGEAEKM